MAIPSSGKMMKPFLEAIKDGREYHWREVLDPVARTFGATEEQLGEKLASGRPRFENRIQWLILHLNVAGVVERIGNGRIRITDRGREFLATNRGEFTMRSLLVFPEYAEWEREGKQRQREARRQKEDPNDPSDSDAAEDGSEGSPEEIIGDAYQRHRALVIGELLDQVRKREPSFLENLLKDLMPLLGYGETEVTGRTGDEGVDAVVREDLLGFEHIYVQAKRWENPVGRPEIQRFLGSLVGKHAKKGIFVTTSRFTKEAIEFVDRLEHRIILIDGDALGRLMYDYKLGVQEKENYRIMTIDHNYFEED